MAGTVAWVVITADSLYPFLVAPQLDALRTAALKTGQADPFVSQLPVQSSRVRQSIASNPRNRLSATANSVPPECVWMLCWLMIEALQDRIPQLKLTDDQKKQIEDAKADMEKLREREDTQLLISQPNDPESDPAMAFGPTATVVESSTRLATRRTLGGL
jgi:hypothetical protein